MRRRKRKNQYIFTPEPSGRRRHGRGKGIGIVLLMLVAAVLITNFVISHQVTQLQQKVTVQNLPDELENWSILHISDLHGQTIGEGQSAILRAVGQRGYSCIVFTGDMVGQSGDPGPFLELVSRLPADIPKLLIPGDDDPPLLDPTAHSSLSVYSEWAERVQAAGVTLLDEPVSFTRGKSTIWFIPESLYSLDLNGTRAAYQAQLDNLTAQQDLLTPDQSAQKRVVEYQLARMDHLKETIAAMKPTDIQVALTHTPLTHEYAATMLQWSDPAAVFSLRNASLLLAGHYVGGQWRLPYGRAIYVPAFGWLPDDSLITGLDWVGGIPQYISPGLGASSYYPWQPGRLFNGPAITVVTLTAKLT